MKKFSKDRVYDLTVISCYSLIEKNLSHRCNRASKMPAKESNVKLTPDHLHVAKGNVGEVKKAIKLSANLKTRSRTLTSLNPSLAVTQPFRQRMYLIRRQFSSFARDDINGVGARLTNYTT